MRRPAPPEEPSVGGLSHVTWWAGGDCHNLDSWDSEEAFNDFGQQGLGPVMAKLGVQSEMKVTFHPAHEVWLPQPVKITAWPAKAVVGVSVPTGLRAGCPQASVPICPRTDSRKLRLATRS